MEARQERLESADSPVGRALNIITSSSVIIIICLIIGLVATTMCLPILLLLKIASFVFPRTSQGDIIDSCVQQSYDSPSSRSLSLAQNVAWSSHISNWLLCVGPLRRLESLYGFREPDVFGRAVRSKIASDGRPGY